MGFTPDRTIGQDVRTSHTMESLSAIAVDRLDDAYYFASTLVMNSVARHFQRWPAQVRVYAGPDPEATPICVRISPALPGIDQVYTRS